MIHAYNEVYLSNVMHNLSALFDIAINAMNLDADEFTEKFLDSCVASGIESGNPNYLSGKSATEMLSLILNTEIPFTQIPLDRSPEYWAGWILAYTQWQLNKPFKTIINVIPFSKLVSLYNPYHEAPEQKTVDKIRALFPSDCPLKRIRQLRNLSQKQLSLLSGVKLRSIQCYEQGDIDIKNAQGETLYALAKTLDCTIEDLMQ